MAPAVAALKKRQQHHALRCYSTAKEKKSVIFFGVFAFAVGYPLQSLAQRTEVFLSGSVLLGKKRGEKNVPGTSF